MNKRTLRYYFIMTIISVLLLAGCTDSTLPLASAHSSDPSGKEFVIYEAGSFDSYDTAVIARIDTAYKEITFYNYDLKKFYTLNYNGATYFADRFQTAVSIDQLNIGDLVDVWFLKEKRTIAGVCEAPETFIETGIVDYELNT